MVPSVRKAFNDAFTDEKYQAFLEDLHAAHPGAIEFRVAETPVFVPKGFRDQMVGCCEYIIDQVLSPGYMDLTARAIPIADHVPGETRHCHMFAFDFGVCENEQGQLEPQLIEMQGFPTLYAFEAFYPDVVERHFNIPDGYTHYFGGIDMAGYISEMKNFLLGDHDPQHVILLEIKPHEQKTRIDFYCTEEYWGIKPVCITELIQEGRKLFYMRNGVKTHIERIYNRVIFDDLHAHRDKLGSFPDITQDLDVEWLPHPNWFYRVSKFTLPLLRNPHVPETHFLSDVKQIPTDLENWVLKPLFSFAGQGVVIDITTADIEGIKDPENWILQRKVKYAEAIETPDGHAKAEIRMMYIWKEGEARPKLITNLARLSKGKMIGVRYNKDKTWVGGSVAYFESKIEDR